MRGEDGREGGVYGINVLIEWRPLHRCAFPIYALIDPPFMDLWSERSNRMTQTCTPSFSCISMNGIFKFPFHFELKGGGGIFLYNFTFSSRLFHLMRIAQLVSDQQSGIERVERRWEYERWTKERRSENNLEGLWKWDAKPRLGAFNCENTRKFLTSKRDTFSLLLLFQLFLQLSVSSARPFSSLFPLRFHTRSSPPLYCSAFCLRNGPNSSSLLLCRFLQWFPSFPRLSLWSAESSLFVRICQCVLDFNFVEFSCEDQ